MKAFIHLPTIAAAMCLAIQPALAQQPPSGAKDAPAAQSTPSPAEFDKQYAKMQEQMSKMQEQMDKIRQAKDPQERQRLLQDHWATMQSAMTAMHGMWGPGQMACCGNRTGGGHMGHMGMGGPMWGDYSKLTPEQLRQRQYMMDRWMPMQQMMMDHMMQHQHWMMMQPQPQSTPNQ